MEEFIQQKLKKWLKSKRRSQTIIKEEGERATLETGVGKHKN